VLCCKQLDGLFEELERGQMINKLGFSRFNINYFFDLRDVQYILSAVHFVATHGIQMRAGVRSLVTIRLLAAAKRVALARVQDGNFCPNTDST